MTRNAISGPGRVLPAPLSAPDERQAVADARKTCFGHYDVTDFSECERRGCAACRAKPECEAQVWVRDPGAQAIRDALKRAAPAKSDGSTANYYDLPTGATRLQDIISYLNCNAQLGEIGRAWMRYGRCPHSERERDLRKIIFYAQEELKRLEKYETKEGQHG